MTKLKLNLQIILIIELIVLLCLGHGVNANGQATNISADYHIETESKGNWFKAFNGCTAKRMNLVSLDTKEKTEALTTELKKVFGNDHPNIWIGGNDNKKNREFIWMTANKAFGYTNWAPGQPDNKHGVEHCVMLWENHNYRWNDGNCLAKLAYVCEKRN
ncbi:lectin subunit alpha [Stomoxys calcitrans]|uniref:C-type lectin domain-containing protein n=1 Tax=Stomoxys calcitrans TaxID=35570 RepID=A0A1I8PFV3_STOCA|nr:lectin subunit alpha [Stomoxys calcitrans]